MRGVKSTVLISVTGVLILGACGGGSGATHPFARPITAIDPADQARAEAMLITSDDLPAAWSATPHGANKDRGATCVDGSGLTETGNAFADDLERNDAGYDIGVENQVIVFQSEDQATTWFENLRDESVPACLKRRFVEAQTKHPDPSFVIDVTAVGRLPVAKVGDESSGLRLTAVVTEGARKTPVYVDFVFVRVGDSGSLLVLINAQEPFDDTEQISASPTTADLAGVIADRMESARAS
jgi:hypothetical protein